MYKTLAMKALVPVGIAVTGFVVVCYLLLYSAVKNEISRDAVQHATNLTDTILKSTRYAMLKSDRETLNTIIQNVGEQTGVEHVRIFNKKGVVNISTKPGEVNRQVDKNTEGCIACHRGPVPITSLGTMQQARTFKNAANKEVMAITAPIYNEPECSNAACHFHSSSQKVLGILDIGLSQDSFRDTLATIRTQMIIFSLMTLMLTVGGVTALLRRSIFLPMQQLRQYLEQSEKGGEQLLAPPRLPHELDSIAKCYYNLSLKFRKCEQGPGETKSETAKQK
jgi:sensor histidine kinase regulating citrate/malate metabolism